MKKWRNKILSAVLVLSLLLTSSSFAFAVGEDENVSDGNYILIDRTEIETLTPSSQINSGAFASENIEWAFDGGIETTSNNEIWHSNWNYTDNDRYVIVELKEKQWINKFVYYPRKNSSNGRFKNCSIYISENGTDWGNAITSTAGDWENNDTAKTLTFESVYTKYIKIVGDHTYGDTADKFASALEMQLFKDGSKYATITSQPENIVSSTECQLSVTATGTDLTYQWYVSTSSDGPFIPVAGDMSETLSVTPESAIKYYYVSVIQDNNGSPVATNSNIVSVAMPDDKFLLTKVDGLDILGCSSEYSTTPAKNAIDGKKGSNTDFNETDFWETLWSGDNERYISVDLGEVRNLSAIKYYPRCHNSFNGAFKTCEIYVSSDGNSWTLAYSNNNEGDEVWGPYQSGSVKEIEFDTIINARYVKLVAPQTYGSNPDTTAAASEIEFYVDTTFETSDIITAQPQGGTIASTGAEPLVLNVGAKEGSSYQWYSNDENSYIGATAISDAVQASYTPANETKYYFVKVTNGNKSVYSDIVLVKSTEAKITRNDGNYVGTLSEAVNAAQAGETIEIVRDIDLTSEITVGKNITVKSSEGNSFVLNRTESSKGVTLFNVNGGANVTFENIIIDGGVIWSGTEDSVLGRGTTANGITGSSKQFFDITNGTLTLSNAVLRNNHTTSNGGIITVGNGNTNSVLNIENSEIYNNYSTGFASAIYAKTSNSNSTGTCTVNITNSEIYGNKTTNGTGSTILLEQGADLTISGGEIRNNDGNSNGGAVYLFGESTATVKDNAIISNNKSSNGGAFTLKNNDNAQLIIEDGVQLINNIGGSDGGAIYIARGTVNVGAATISGNHSNWGGAVYVGGGTANFTDTIITENRATGGRGGAFNINKVSSDIATTVNINGNTQIFKNSASAHGGAINIQNGTVNLNGGLISENTATQNGGAIYLGFTDGTISGNGTLNLGSSGNDFALTISENTASNGSGIYYGENGTMNINAKLNLDDEIFLYTNGLKINQKCDLSGNAPITLVGNRQIEEFITVNDDGYKSSALNVFRVKDGSPATLKPTVISGSDLNVVRNSSMSISKDLGDNLTYFRGIENNLYKVTGANVYTWYTKATDSNEFTEVGTNLDSLSNGTHTVYCVASDGTNYMVSDVAEITVKDFVPCSKAIDKFKNL